MNDFSIFHLNVRSLVKNHEDLSPLLANIDHKFSVLAITETWIKDDDPYDLNFDGYNSISNHRSDRTGGGVGLYIDEKLTYQVLTEYNISNSSVFESLFVEICIPNNKNILIGAIYCPPNGNPEEFLDKFNESLSSLTRANKLTGDFNLDLMKHETHSITAQFFEVTFSYGLIPLITKPTRITAHSVTLIDNIFTNNTNVLSKNGLIISDLSDHFPIYSAIATDHHSEKGRHHIIVGDINEIRIQDFKSKLANIDWTSTKNAPDTNAMYDSFIEKYTGLFDSCFPFRTIKGKALNSFRKP